jgi:hypothetical protein
MRVVAAIAASVLFPASAQAAANRVTWPEAREYRPGETARLKVAAKRPVNVVFVRENADGKVQRVLARRALRRGQLSLQFGNPGRYALRVGKATRRFVVNTMCDDIGDKAELRLGATRVRAGGVLAYLIVNTSDNFGCVIAGVGSSLERQLPDGTWSPVNPGQGSTLQGIAVAPWAPFAKQLTVPADAAPGTYRVTDYVTRRERGTLPERIDLTAQFEITA